MQRIMYLWLPHLPTERLIRRQPHLAHEAFALTERVKNRLEIMSLSAKARAQGLNAGGSLSDARMAVPTLRQYEAQPDKDLHTLRILMRWASRYSPLISRDHISGLYLNMSGATHLIGTEQDLVKDVSNRFERSGFTVKIGIAPHAQLARAVARCHSDNMIVANDNVTKIVQNLPFHVLECGPKHTNLARSLGLKKIGDVLALPRKTIATRFGRDMIDRLDQLSGDAPDTLSYAAHVPEFKMREEYAEPIGHNDDIAYGLDSLLLKLCTHLQQKQKGVLRLRLSIERVDHYTLDIDISTQQPTADKSILNRLLSFHLDGLDIGFGIEAMMLQAFKIAPLNVNQRNLYSAQTSPKNSDISVDLMNDLTNQFGTSSVVLYQPQDIHIPERVARPVSAIHISQMHANQNKAKESWVCGRLQEPLRLINPPQSILVKPRNKYIKTNVPPYIYREGAAEQIKIISGPERIEPIWFLTDPNWQTGRRDYWWVLSESGALLWIYKTEQPHQTQWFLHGLGS